MFERFSGSARHVVIAAQEQAKERKAESVRTEHLLAALFAVADPRALTVLAGFDVAVADVIADIDRLRGAAPPPSDAEALATLGIDLDEVRRQIEEAFGPGALDRTRAALGRDGRPGVFGGHIPFDRSAKKVLQLALREALQLGDNYIGTEHLLLGLMHTETGAAHHILVGRGLTIEAVRSAVRRMERGLQAG